MAKTPINNKFTISNFGVKFMEGYEDLSYYLSVLRKYNSIPVAEELELFRKYREKGDMHARDLIFLHNQRFIYSNAKIYARNSSEVMDYVNEGNIGLAEAIDKFKTDRDTRFITFAVWYIRREMNYYLIETRDIVKKSNAMKLFKKADKIIRAFNAKNGYDPSLEDVKEIMETEYGISIKDLSDLYDLNLTSISTNVDDDFTYEESDEFTEKTSSENTYEEDIDHEYSRAIAKQILAKSEIPPEHKDILKMFYGIDYDRPYTMLEIAKKYKIYPEDLKKQMDMAILYMQDEVKKIKIAV